MLPSTRLGPGREFDAIRRLLERWGELAAGVGDDAAAYAHPEGELLVASIDATIEDAHFRRGWLEPREIGYRAAAAALSDLAAMGARPTGVLVSLALPIDWRDALDALADGIGEAVALAGARIVGGNTTTARELSITTTVLGAARTVLARSGARPGDTLYVTGRLGGPGAALAALERGEIPAPAHRARFAHPVPRIAEARWVVERGAHAAIDISDGLAADLAHVAAASGTRLLVDVARVPTVAGVAPDVALSSGEEYELVVASPVALDTTAFEARFDLPLTAIGEVLEPGPGTPVELRHGDTRVDSARGHDHFSR